MAKKKKTEYKITRRQIIDAAKSLLGTPFSHQGRNPKTGLDCVGFVVEIGKILEYPNIVDDITYRRMPEKDLTLKYLRENLDEIPLEDVRPGDLYLIAYGNRECHVAVLVNDQTDVAAGIHPSFIHARSFGFSGVVREEFCHQLKGSGGKFIKGFRLRGVID